MTDVAMREVRMSGVISVLSSVCAGRCSRKQDSNASVVVICSMSSGVMIIYSG